MPSVEETIFTLRNVEDHDDEGSAVPGVVLVFSGDAPVLAAERLVDGRLEVGRASFRALLANDDRVSRRHVGFQLEGGVWSVTDFGSTNGTSVDGVPIKGTVTGPTTPKVVRIGRTALVPVSDVRRYEGAASVDEVARSIAGPTLQGAWARISSEARRGQSLFLRGESGSGKEVAARLFHAAGSEAGPFVAVNCATIAPALAERLLFGAKRGAYSGADADAEGYIQAAHGGTLFLDEVAELELAVQAKLLRVLETKEVVQLGASKGRKVSLRLCVATHRDLREEVAQGRFREDLYFRVGRPEVSLPPLRARFEEIPVLLARAVREHDDAYRIHVSLVEECLLRHWPGNVRELLAEGRVAATQAEFGGKTTVSRAHLAPTGGLEIRRAPGDLPSSPGTSSSSMSSISEGVSALERSSVTPSRVVVPSAEEARFDEVLAQTEGNVTRAAQILGIHRNRIRRWLEKKRRP